MARAADQHKKDKRKTTYQLYFPGDLDPDRVTAWLRSISGTLRTGPWAILEGSPTIALEVWASSDGIKHYLKVPWQYEPHVKPNLESLVPGIRLEKVVDPPRRVWIESAELGLHNSIRQIDLPRDLSDVSTPLLNKLSLAQGDETIVVQWIVSPAPRVRKPIHGETRTQEVSWRTVLYGMEASRDEVEDRRTKLDEPNMQAVLRIGTVASTPIRAHNLLMTVVSQLKSSDGVSTKFYKRLVSKATLQQRLDKVSSPLQFPVKLSAPELTALLCWPLNNPIVPGLPAPMARRRPPEERVPSKGIVLGQSNYSGRERDVAVGYAEASQHVHVLGGTGAGKTTLLTNMAKQVIEAKHGLILIESKGDLFRQILDVIPADRIMDTIVFDVNDAQRPVGFNILKQGDPSIVTDELIKVFNSLYRDHPSLWMQEMMYYGLKTLASDKAATFIDLAVLVSPNAEDLDWRDNLLRAQTDPQVINFWQRQDNSGRQRQDQKAEPLMSRVWPMSRSKLMNIVGQSTSSFQMEDVVRDNKILLVNLSGIEQGSATIMGTLLLNTLWNTIKAHNSEQGMFLFLDEFHHYMNIPVDLEQMLVESRSMGLRMVLAHQFLGQLTAPNMQQAIMSNTMTKVAFKLNSDDARVMANNFGRGMQQEDLQHLGKFETVAQVNTPTGVSSPLTLTTHKPAQPHGKANQVLYVSRQNYGRDIQAVQDEIVNRHNVASTRKKRPRPSEEGWGGATLG